MSGGQAGPDHVNQPSAAAPRPTLAAERDQSEGGHSIVNNQLLHQNSLAFFPRKQADFHPIPQHNFFAERIEATRNAPPGSRPEPDFIFRNGLPFRIRGRPVPSLEHDGFNGMVFSNDHHHAVPPLRPTVANAIQGPLHEGAVIDLSRFKGFGRVQSASEAASSGGGGGGFLTGPIVSTSPTTVSNDNTAFSSNSNTAPNESDASNPIELTTSFFPRQNEPTGARSFGGDDEYDELDETNEKFNFVGSRAVRRKRRNVVVVVGDDEQLNVSGSEPMRINRVPITKNFGMPAQNIHPFRRKKRYTTTFERLL